MLSVHGMVWPVTAEACCLYRVASNVEKVIQELIAEDVEGLHRERSLSAL